MADLLAGSGFKMANSAGRRHVHGSLDIRPPVFDLACLILDVHGWQVAPSGGVGFARQYSSWSKRFLNTTWLNMGTPWS